MFKRKLTSAIYKHREIAIVPSWNRKSMQNFAVVYKIKKWKENYYLSWFSAIFVYTFEFYIVVVLIFTCQLEHTLSLCTKHDISFVLKRVKSYKKKKEFVHQRTPNLFQYNNSICMKIILIRKFQVTLYVYLPDKSRNQLV